MEIEVLEGVFDANEMIAGENRRLLDEAGVYMINLMASPGAGKTSVIMRTLEGIQGHLSGAVIEGDVAGKVDSEQIAATGVPAVQINTGGSCHLEARQVNGALKRLDLEETDLVIVENVGNLVCPAEFKLGEDLKVMILSVAEGHDKPLKYPLMFSESDVLIVNKTDLIPHTDFDMVALEKTVLKMNPGVVVFKVSCRTGEGLQEWNSFLVKKVRDAKQAAACS
ncbi:MAG: hydrogenase nickel incorporation protein HypB [Actinobacteria bacterium]|nr:hydrogenase nickel incorporation protein HypB [Actinomycetota bacterium]MBU1943337.1 hydrogenase nickel incorporation protein HypB [Actinomycetota bacterium]MBU2686545.1 hydrogenase nickel incorporation protein HypB [Actinomycetota bacterium]